MSRTAAPLIFAIVVCVTSLANVSESAASGAPERAKGISMHMLPKRVADLESGKWGFVVTYADYLKRESEPPILSTKEEFLSFVQKQNAEVQKNGVWIVTTHPDAYSEAEKKLLDDVKAICRKERIPLFICRASQLPNGWKRYDLG
jgi:hypothetical protein